MNRLILIIAAACLLLAGCKEKEKAKSSSDSTSGNPLNAPAEYGKGLVRAQQSAQRTVGVTGLDQAIKNFFVEENRYPKDLNELKSKGVAIPDAPAGMKWQYDPNTGVVKVVPQ